MLSLCVVPLRLDMNSPVLQYSLNSLSHLFISYAFVYPVPLLSFYFLILQISGMGKCPRVLHLSTSWRWVVGFTPWALYPQGKSPPYPLQRTQGGPQNRSGWRVKRRKILPLPGLEFRPVDRAYRSQSLYRLWYTHIHMENLKEIHQLWQSGFDDRIILKLVLKN
jgi:hypothetical protein